MSTNGETKERTFRRSVGGPPLRVRGVSVTLGANDALREVDLDVGIGEAVALVGPNGAGKSTLLHLVAGLLRPRLGTVDVFGRGSPEKVAARVNVGFAPQANALYDELTVEENLRFFASLRSLPREAVEEAVREGLAFARLDDRRRARVGTLSGGMKRRLHVASAAIGGVELLVLDEPFVGIDASSCNALVASLRAKCDSGVALLFSTHEGTPLDLLAPRSVRLERGRLVA